MTPKAQVYAKYKGARTSVKKARTVADLIRGKDLKDAKVTLAFHQSKAANLFLQVLKSAEANAVNNNKLNPATLYVADAQVSPGPTMKRARIVAYSRVNPILKRTAHLVVGLSEKENK
ncbi:50S ribosomal protein L22 [candidate division WWE3 bacterium]|nr:50S ribosomal protein L22 [candidate division WWE3 bacterium]